MIALKTAIIFIIIFLGILLFAKNSQAASYYVKNGGNDNAAGTSDATAWARSPGMAGWSGSATLQSGDIVYFRSQDAWSASSGEYILDAAAGVTYNGSAYGSGTRAVLRKTGGMDFGVQIRRSNVVFTGFEVDGNNQAGHGIVVGYYNATGNISNITVDNSVIHNIGNSDTYYYGLAAEPFNGRSVTDLKFTNNKVYNVVHEGITLYPSWQQTGNVLDTVLVRGNEVYNTGTASASFGNGILIKDDVRNATIEFNYLHDNYTGIQHELYSAAVGVPNNIHIRYNVLSNNANSGILFYDNPNIAYGTINIYGNLITNNGESGSSESVGIIWYNFNYGGSVFNVYNNTILQVSNGGSNKYGIWFNGSGSPTVNLKNNIIYTTGQTAVYDPNRKFIHSNNLIYRTDSATAEHVNNGTSYNRSGVLTWEPTAQNTDPTFKNISSLPTGFTGTYGSSMVPNTDGLSISSGNAIDRGVTLASPYNGAINLSGKGQTRSGAFDIGAYEYVSSSPPPPDTTPPTPPTGVQIQ